LNLIPADFNEKPETGNLQLGRPRLLFPSPHRETREELNT
jgi:hypothetical protein